jgi:hypothetical protein
MVFISRHAKAAAGSPSRLVKLLRFGFTVYLLSAVCYTGFQCLVKPAWNLVFPPDEAPFASVASNDNATIARNTHATTNAATPKSTALDHNEKMANRPPKYGVQDTNWGMDQMDWHPVTHALAHHAPQIPEAQRLALDAKSTPMAEDFFLSKAFGEALQPSKVVPYYYKASQEPIGEDITITTLVTSNRFKVFATLVERYQGQSCASNSASRSHARGAAGPISVTIHVTSDADRNELLESLHELYTTSPYMSTYVDVHLVIDTFERQFNMWRNVAKFFARTDYVMMLDVDFWLCTDFRSRILNSPAIMSKLREGQAAFVVPAFEFSKQEDGLDAATFPTTKAEVAALAQEAKIGMFHKSWEPGHGATNYTRYYASKPGEVYKVHGYTHSYEPYVVFKKEGTPYCDERFIGYGGNKAACLYELYLSGVSYFVLPDDFLIHQSHPYAEKARKHEVRTKEGPSLTLNFLRSDGTTGSCTRIFGKRSAFATSTNSSTMGTSTRRAPRTCL